MFDEYHLSWAAPRDAAQLLSHCSRLAAGEEECVSEPTRRGDGPSGISFEALCHLYIAHFARPHFPVGGGLEEEHTGAGKRDQ